MRDNEKSGGSLLESAMLTGRELLLGVGILALSLLLLRGATPCVDEPIADLWCHQYIVTSIELRFTVSGWQM